MDKTEKPALPKEKTAPSPNVQQPKQVLRDKKPLKAPAHTQLTPFDPFAAGRANASKRQMGKKQMKSGNAWSGSNPNDYEWDVDGDMDITVDDLLASPWLRSMLYTKDAFTLSCIFPGQFDSPYVTHRALPYPTATISTSFTFQSKTTISSSPVGAPFTVIFFCPVLGAIMPSGSAGGFSIMAGPGITIGDYDDGTTVGTCGAWTSATTMSANYRDNPFTGNAVSTATYSLFNCWNRTSWTETFGASPTTMNSWVFPWSSQLDINLEAAAATASGSVYTGSLSLLEATSNTVSFATLLARAEKQPVVPGGTYSIKSVVTDATIINQMSPYNATAGQSIVWLQRVSYMIIRKPFASITGGNSPSFIVSGRISQNYAYQPIVSSLWNESRSRQAEGYKQPPASNPNECVLGMTYEDVNNTHVTVSQEAESSWWDTLDQIASMAAKAGEIYNKAEPYIEMAMDFLGALLTPEPPSCADDFERVLQTSCSDALLAGRGRSVGYRKVSDKKTPPKPKKPVSRYKTAVGELTQGQINAYNRLILKSYAAPTFQEYLTSKGVSNYSDSLKNTVGIYNQKQGDKTLPVETVEAYADCMRGMTPLERRMYKEYVGLLFQKAVQKVTAEIKAANAKTGSADPSAVAKYMESLRLDVISWAPGTVISQVEMIERYWMDIDVTGAPTDLATLVRRIGEDVLLLHRQLENSSFRV